MKNILDSRVRNYRGYRLQETVLNLEDRDYQIKQITSELEKISRNISEKSLEEGTIVGRGIYALVSKFITLLLMGEVDAVSGETGGVILLLPALAKNAWELSRSNKKIRPIIEKVSQQNLTPKDVNDLEKLVSEIKGDLSDLVSATILALPGYFGTDTAAAGFAAFFEDKSIEKIQSMRQSFNAYKTTGGLVGTLCKIIEVAGYFVGGNAIGEALENLEKAAAILEAGGVKMVETRPSIDPARLEDMQDSDGMGPTPSANIDSDGDGIPDPGQGSHLRIVDPNEFDDDDDDDDLGPNNLSESNLNLKRWQKLSGLI